MGEPASSSTIIDVTDYEANPLVGTVRIDIFLRDVQTKPGLRDQLNAADDLLRITSRQDVAAASNGLRTLGRVSQRHRWHMEDTALFLDRAAVREHAECSLFHLHKVKQIERRAKLDQWMQLNREFFQFRASARVKAPDHRIVGFPSQPIESGHDSQQTLRHIHIFCTVSCDQEKLSLSDPQSIQHITGQDVSPVML